MVRPVEDDDIGLKVLREAPAEATQIIDIVAIHGIGAHPDDTWCKNVGTAASEEWVNWLDKENMLPAVAPHARIMRYGYQSQWFGEGAIRQHTSAVAQRLLLALNRRRGIFQSRPLIFIAHCFGGLVVLKALVDARHDVSMWPGVFTSTTGLLFFGTPFRGAKGMDLVEMLEAARSQYQEDEVQMMVLKILEPGNEFLQELVDQFGKTRMLANKAKIACFYELTPSNVGKIVGKQNRTRFVVSESSGCLDLSDATSKFSLSRTHFNMNKFGKPTEEDFEIVRDVIQKMVSEAYCVVPTRSQPSKSVSEHNHVPHTTLAQRPIVIREAPTETPQINTTLVLKASKNNRKKKVQVPKAVNTWPSAEDERLLRTVQNEMLLHTVQTMKPSNWKHVASFFGDRSPYACEKRHEKLIESRKATFFI